MSFEQMRELPSRMIECRESDGAIIIRDATAEELAAWEASWTPPEDDGHCWVTLLPLGE